MLRELTFKLDQLMQAGQGEAVDREALELFKDD